MKNKLGFALVSGSIVLFSNVANALPFGIWGYKNYTVDKVNPFFIPDVIVLEREGSKKWYFMPNSAIEQCSLDEGDSASIQILENDPLNNMGIEGLKNSDDANDRRLGALLGNPLAKGISGRIVKNVFGCGYDLR